MEQIKHKYFVANGLEGPAGLNEMLHNLKRIQAENATKSAQYDILFLHNGLTALLKVDLGRPQVKFWYDDFGYGRAAPMSVREAIVNFIKPTLNKPDTRDEDILVVHFDDRSLEKNRAIQRDAGFFSGGKMNIEGEDVLATSDLQDADIAQLTADLKQQNVPAMDFRKVVSLLKAQKELDAIASPANEYGKTGRYKTLFAKQETRTLPEEVNAHKPSKPFSKNG